MRTIAFVGPSGTGKSHRAMMVARKYGADAIIDDGLLISGHKILAGTSAKREPTKLASIRCALFTNPQHIKDVSNAIISNKLKCVMILGTSDGMVKKIANVLELPEISKTIYIDDIATADEMKMAQDIRNGQGKHVIPVPTFEIKKDFSGYFMHPLKIFQKNMDSVDTKAVVDKSIVRPTFSYLGDYELSDNVILDIASYEAMNVDNVVKINSINVREGEHGAHLDMTVVLKYGCNIRDVCKEIQKSVRNGVERFTSVNTRRVHIYVKNIVL